MRRRALLLWRSPRSRRALRALLGLALAPIVALVVAAAFTPLPAELREGAARSQSTRYLDRDGGLLREVRADDATRARWIALDEVGENAVKAMLAAEDRRFPSHPGVDPLAVARAAASSLWHRRIVSGASTLSMQLARLVRPHRRDLFGKLGEMALALRIEASLSKDRILEEYVNRAPFGPGLRGMEAASRFYLDKPTKDLSLAEAASLAALPRGPAVYAMTKHPERVVRRRDRILDRMRSAGWISAEEAESAKQEPLTVRAGKGSFGAPHLIASLTADRRAGGVVHTTIQRGLQGEIEQATRATLRPLARRHVTAASVVVIDNATGGILAYVGSPDFDDARHGGQNDGVRAHRQPGSTLKPFVYGLAIERLGFTPATLLPDIELVLPVASGVYAPKNYDERFHGPVRLRDALASSLNVPAVWTTNELGVAPLLERLRALGFASLGEEAEWYGPALALGDGEVTLLELANAYATIARGGVWRETRAVKDDGAREADRRVMPVDVAATLTDVLADKGARVAAFGEGSALELPFEVAAKTGTSKGFRDNWTVGFTRAVTVAVWVGNFDGSSMEGVSGITGAAPLFRAVMEAAMRGRPDAAPASMRLASTDGFTRVDICPLSGGRTTHACGHVVHEWIPSAKVADLRTCAMHETLSVDVRNGLRAGRGCPSAFIAERSFERFDAPFTSWAAGARRDVAPDAFSLLCPATRDDARASAGPLRIGYPRDGARFLVDPDRPRSDQALAIRVDAPPGANSVEVRIDGRFLARVGAPFVATWSIAPGDHVLTAEARGLEPSEPVHVRVE